MNDTLEISDISCNKNWLEKNPFPMMAIDLAGCIRWVNPAFESLAGTDRDSLLGCSAQDLPAPELADLLDDKSPVRVIHPERGEIWLERIVRQVSEPDENALQMHYFQEKTPNEALVEENHHLKQQLESLILTDELTGLANERALSQHLATQVTRSRRYNNPLTLVLVNIEVDIQKEDNAGKFFDDAVIAASHFLRERLRWADFIARSNDGRFIIVMPETGSEEATVLFNIIIGEKDKMELPEAQKAAVKLSFGLAEWEKGNDPKLLVERALQSLE